MAEYQLLWSQEFDGPAGTEVSPEIWNFDIGDGSAYGIPGWGNQEREYYLSAAASLDGSGNLVISADRLTPAGGDSMLQCYYGPAEWTSAKLTTFGKVAFHYGRIEASIRAPRGLGTWPALWLLGVDIATTTWPMCGEIDIMEARGDLVSTVYGTLHGPGYSGDKASGKVVDVETNLADAFHTYAVEWTPNSISWYFDELCYATSTPDVVAPHEWVYNKPFYLITNLAMGGNFTGPLDPELQHAQLEIDYIRHYSIDGIGANLLY